MYDVNATLTVLKEERSDELDEEQSDELATPAEE